MRAKLYDNLPDMNEHAADILDSVGDAFIALDLESRVIYANKETGRLLGRDVSGLAEKNITDLVPEAGNWIFHNHLEMAISGGVQVKLDNLKLFNKRFTMHLYPNKKGIIILLHDITLQWHVDEMYRLALVLLDRLNESVYLVRSDGRLFHVNDEASRLLGYSRDELIHMKVFDIEPGIMVDGWESYFTRIREGAHVDLESSLKACDGRVIPVDMCVNYVQLYGSEYYCVAARDITDRKKLEEALADVEDFNHSVLDSLASNIAVLDESGSIVYVNSAWMEFARKNGSCSDEAVGTGINYITVCQNACGDHAEEAPDVVSGIRSVISGEREVFEIEYACHSPDVKRWFQMYVTPFIGRKMRGVVVYHNDITRRKEVEEALGESEENLARAQETSHIGSWYIDPVTEVGTGSDEYFRILGIPRQEALSFGELIKLVHPDDRVKARAWFDKTLQTKKILDLDLRIVRPDGEERVVYMVNGKFNREGKGRIGLYGTMQDITERKRIEEEELRLSQDMEVRVNELNALHGVYGIMQKGLPVPKVLQGIADILPPAWQYPEVTAARITLDGHVYMTSNFRATPWTQRADFHTVNGKQGVIEVSYLEKRPDETEGPFLSDERALINSFAEMLRLYLDKWYVEEALTAAKNQAELYLDLMSHDINNLNQVALGYLELIEGMVKDKEIKELVAKPIAAVNNSTYLIENVMKLQKAITGQLKTEAVDMDKILTGLQAQYSHVQGKDITIHYTHDNDGVVLADRLIKDAFSNLIGNAIKHSGGESVQVYIELTKKREEEKDYCLVTIADNGPGIPDDQKDKIFTRFHRGSTKTSGKGLGLYLVKMLVDSHHGKVWVEDRVAGDHTRGAKFVVVLPAMEK